MNPQLKRDLLIMAGYLSPFETLPMTDSAASFKDTVMRLCADRTMTLTQMALIATRLAAAIDEQGQS